MSTITFQITVTLPEKVPGYANPQVAARMVLADALCEFQGHRRPIKDYLDRRYPLDQGYEWVNREEKAEQIFERCNIARNMAESIIIIEEEAK